MTNPKPSRTRWKIALGVVVLFAVVGWLVAWPAYQRHRAIQEIERVGGETIRETVGPQWMIQLGFGFHRVTGFILDETEITNDGLKHLSCLNSFHVLSLDGTRITDNGLKHLSGLTNLEVLGLGETNVSDDGLKHLSGMTSLDDLWLVKTQVSDNGVRMLQESLPNCYIDR